MTRDNKIFLTVLVCFFLSGLAALVYQTVWMRYFSIVFGTSELAVVTVLVAYMGGLALGAAAIGRVVNRLKRPVLVYAVLELGIAVSAALVPWGLQLARHLYVAVMGHLQDLPESMGIGQGLFYLSAGFLVLMVPTLFMGATLPLLTKGVVHTQEQIGKRIGLLYAINTLGAICGTLLAAFMLVPSFGLRWTAGIGVGVNIIAGLLGLAAARSFRSEPRGRPDSSKDSVTKTAPKAAGKSSNDRPIAEQGIRWSLIWVVFPLMMVSGSISFAYEVLWTRLLGQVVGGSMTAFATMLASFLLGITLGSMVASRLATSAQKSAWGLALAQSGAGLLSVAVYYLLSLIPAWAISFRTQGWSPLSWTTWSSMLVLLPSTLCIGATFPFAVRIVTRRPQDAAEASARVYCWNTIGAIAGAFLAGFFLVPWLGFSGMIKLAVLGNLCLALVALYLVQRHNGAVVAGAIAVLIFGFVFRPGIPIEMLRASRVAERMSKENAAKLVYYEVGRSATVVGMLQRGNYLLRTNGLPEANVSLKGSILSNFSQKSLAVLPCLLNLDAESVLVIGLGGGEVVNAIPPQIKTIDVVELEEKVVEANRQIAAARVKDPLADPRVRIVINDARNALALTEKKFDVVISQPSHPWTAGASHLYTREFLQEVHDHLTPGGIMLQWIGTGFVDQYLARSMVATVQDVFASVRVFLVGDSIFIAGSNQRMNSLNDLLNVAGKDASIIDRTHWYKMQFVEDFAASLVLDEEGAAQFANGAPLSTDDHNLMATHSSRLLDDRHASLDAKPETIWTDHDIYLNDNLLSELGADPRWSQARLLWRVGLYQNKARQSRLLAALQDSEAAVAKGFLSVLTENWAAAWAECDKVLQNDPYNREARLYAAVSLLAGIRFSPERQELFIDASQVKEMTPKESQFRELAAGLTDQDRSVLNALYYFGRRDWGRIHRLDQQLVSAVSERNALLPFVVIMRAMAWTTATQGSLSDQQRAEDGKKILRDLERVIAAGYSSTQLLDLRGQTAAMTGQEARFVDTIWLLVNPLLNSAPRNQSAEHNRTMQEHNQIASRLLGKYVPRDKASRSPTIQHLIDSLESEGLRFK